MNYLLLFLAVSLPIMGMVYAVLGSVKLPLAERLGIDEARVGGLVSAYGFMVGPVILICGFLTDAFGRMPIITGGSILAACALFLLARTRSYGLTVVAVLMLSGGWAAMINVGNVLMYLAMPENPSRATNLGDFFFGLGAFLAPMVIVLMMKRISYTGAVSVLGGLALLTAIMAPWASMQAAGESKPVDTSVLLRDPVMWLSAFTLMFYVPLESSTAAWVTTFVTRLSPAGENPDRGRRIASWALSGFWLCFMGARLITSFFIHAQVEHLIHIILAIAITAALAAIIFVRNRPAMILLLILIGLLFGPFFPTLMGILLGHFPVEVHGRAVGILFGLGSIGWTIIPALIGAYAARTDIQKSFRIAAGAGMILIALVVAHYLQSR